MIMDSFNYTFAALRGIQAGREYFVAMCPLRLIPKIFYFNETDEIPPDLRAQRVLNRGRIPAISRYLVENQQDYVFSAITASIDGEVSFQPFADKGPLHNAGQITVPMSATFIVNDGQHRRAAIEEALKECPSLGDETIAVVFFIDAGLKRSQQLFADLNTHAVRASASIGILYNFRDPLAQLSRTIANQVPVFKGFTDMERSSIPNRSTKLFTLSGIYHATAALLKKSDGDDVLSKEQHLAIGFWTELSKIIPEWQDNIIRRTSSADLRRDYVLFHSVLLNALGLAGADLVAQYPDAWNHRLHALETVDWSRSNTNFWEGRAMIGGHLSKSRTNVLRTAMLLKQIMGLQLTESEQREISSSDLRSDKPEWEEAEA
ncbi:MAG: DNA sulfur modification protein DndB [Chloroflexi bacterium AL-W]|nr:DNA sulfur modification protein DndB [Chloroflexi bacterium AL-N1]NOK71041.1 DNA sulfur modification protein DndB [Chloroflexi bacterium AL-N10]NOK72736.1 DNA sulfur modification protein DndB [Chloroflexi bacterium AL-N5]NOK79176.1 DNA sulfur modification protein DndB [Chloroflexi bacterium AL-W]NOK87091.1 DNA sulfur modification protein DndB [Chloroflexi bacterium AL-N15]